MSCDSIVHVAGLSKRYRLYDEPRQRLWEALPLVSSKPGREFWALRDISFSVARGESMAIIGSNGSGKSTLLQCIAGTLAPTDGEITVDGRVAALLELGTGFNPEFSGRENVFLATAVLGLSRKQTQSCFDSICEFADIGEFMERPVKSYSSGMVVRLGFAVQTATSPDLLIVDEALAVGDIFFQQKCLARMRQLRDAGTTILFVSHDMGMVRDLTQRAVYLREGQVETLGPTHSTIQAFMSEQSAVRTPERAAPSAADSDPFLESAFLRHALWSAGQEKDDAPAYIVGMALVDEAGEPALSVRMGESLTFRVLYKSFVDEPLHVAIVIKNRHDQVVASRGSYTEGLNPPVLTAGEAGLFELAVDFHLEAGEYTFCARLGTAASSPNQGVSMDVTDWLGPVQVTWDYASERAPFLGMFGLPVRCSFSREPR